MFNASQLPLGYEPFETLKVCSNVLSNGTHLLVVGQILPLIIGKGSRYPKVWLRVPLDSSRKNWIQLVDASRSSANEVVINKTEKSVDIVVKNKFILNMHADGAHAVVEELDLRSVGLNLYGDSTELHAGSTSLMRNSMDGGFALVAFGSRPE